MAKSSERSGRGPLIAMGAARAVDHENSRGSRGGSDGRSAQRASSKSRPRARRSDADATGKNRENRERASSTRYKKLVQTYCHAYSPRSSDERERAIGVFLREFAKHKEVGRAAHEAGHPREYFYRLRKELPEFAAAWQAIFESTVDRLEATLMRRAIEGWDKPVYQQGRLVGMMREHSPQLGMFIISRLRPDQYGERVTVAVAPEEYARRVRDAFARQDEEAMAASKKQDPQTKKKGAQK